MGSSAGSSTGSSSASAAVGLVVGATDTEAMGEIRKVAPQTWILCPGVGTQGGNINEGIYIYALTGYSYNIII